MKKLIVMIVTTFLAVTEGMAADYSYLCLQKSDGSVAVVSTTDLTLSVGSESSVTLTVNGTAYTVSDLSYMWFSNTAAGENIITIPSAGWATFCSGSALDYTSVDGLTPYTATFNTAAATVTLHNLTAAVPASTGVVLEGTEGTYHVPVATTASAPANNDLLGTTAALETTSAYNYYALALDGSSVGFKLVSTGVTIPAGKAYYRYATAKGTIAYFGHDDETTGINSVDTPIEEDDSPVYDLQGRLVKSPGKGIYIKNGKKIIIK